MNRDLGLPDVEPAGSSWRVAGLIRRLRTPTFAVAEYRQPAEHRVPEHRHDGAGFVLTLGGAFRWRSSGARAGWCEAGAMLVVPPAERHSERVSPSGSHALIVYPEPSWAAAEGLAEGLLARWSLIDDPQSRVVSLRAARELRRADCSTSLCIESLLAEALQAAGVRVAAASRGLPAWLARVRERLDDEYDRSHTLVSLAAGEGVSRSLLAREFRRAHGATVGEYLRARRLERAAIALVATRCPLRDVALDHGYYDQSHFTAAFRRLFGVTPGAYRREVSA